MHLFVHFSPGKRKAMADLRLGSVVIGINNYANEYYRHGEYELEFAEADALAFHNYLTAAWPNSLAENQIVLRNQDATTSRIKSALSELASKGPFDLFFFYFAGHGEKSDENAWLCTLDAMPGKVDLAIDELDTFISNIQSNTIILVIDCCYAEGIISRSDCMKSLRNSQARLFICSARAEQRTWEEKDLGHGIFSYVLIRALSKGSSIATSGDGIDVDKELFPYLCEQVPLLVYKYKKGHRQEPVKGGLSTSDVRLPIAETGFGGIGSSIYEVVRRRYRQALAVTVLVVLLAFLFIQIFFYHLAIDPTGRVVVRNGTREAFGFLPRSLGTRIDTGFDTAALSSKKSTENLALLSKLQSGQIWGVWTQNSVRGYRSWVDSLTPLLSEKERERATLLLTGDLSQEMRAYIQKSSNGGDSWLEVDSWRTKLVAESLLLNPKDGTERIRWLLKQVPKIENVNLTSSVPPKNVMDFSVLNLSSSEVVNHLNALRIYATTNSTVKISDFDDVFKLVSYRVLFSTLESQDDTRKEILALGALFRTICLSRQTAGAKGITTEEVYFLNHCLDAWCAATASVALSSVGEFTDQRNNIIYLETALQTIEPPGVKLDQIYPLWSMYSLADAKMIDPLFAKKIFEMARRLTREFQDIGEYQRAFIAKVAFSTQVPKEERTSLLQLLRGKDEDGDFTAQNAFLILAANYKFLEDPEKDEVRSWFERNAQRLKTLSYNTQAFAYLGIGGLDGQEIASLLDQRLLPELRVYSSSENLKPGFLNIVSDDGQHAAALGRLAQHVTLSDHIRERLYLYAVNRPDFEESRELFKGLAAQPPFTGNPESLPRSISNSLSYFSKDYYRKRVECEIGLERLLRILPQDRSKVLSQLEILWKDETEPELKMSLGDILIRGKETSF
jgi:hypothetical protein